MSVQDEDFIQRLRATFMTEAQEHLRAISSNLLELERSAAGADATAAIECVFREAHSLKGAARAVDFGDIESVCQALESTFATWKQQAQAPSAEALDAVHKALDEIRASLPDGGSGGVPREYMPSQVSAAQASRGAPPVPPAQAMPVERRTPSAPRSVIAVDTSETVRVSVAKLNAHLRQAEEMLLFKSTAAQHAAELRAVAALVSEWRRKRNSMTGDASATEHDASALSGRLEKDGDFLRSLETRLAALAAGAHQDRHATERRIDELLVDSKKLLMLPFSTITDLFPKLVRDLCRDQGKEAELLISGGDVEMDKRILEEMKDILLHVLRNCVDHGIEPREERLRRHKPACAVISLRVSQVHGSKVEIAVSDDGAGVDIERVKASAVSHGIVSQAQANAMTDADALPLVFQSQVSTSPTITAVSGRGLGMAIVRSKVDLLEGNAAIASALHVGTTLRMVLPLTLATFRGVLIRAGQETFVLPAAHVERALRIAATDIRLAENREVLAIDGQAVSLVRLAPLLNLAVTPWPGGQLPVLVLRFMGQRMAFVVDELLHEQEVLVKPFQKPLVRVRHFTGATLLGNGVVAPVLNVADLMASARLRGMPPSLEPAPGIPRAAKARILVVEDSITSRMMLKGILAAAGFDVIVAADGMEAYAVLRQEAVDLVVSDVEMPRLNGVDLTARIRADKKLAELPVILVTALESREQRERGMDAGANAYIAKSNFAQNNLIDVVRRLI